MPARPFTTALTHPVGRVTTRVAMAALIVVLLTALLAATQSRQPRTPEALGPVDLSAATPNPVTPGDFEGYGFDQCLTPSQTKMEAWRWSSPYLAVGVYISGNSRFCRDQPNLTPRWVRNQLQRGWKILPITLGPQASCLGRFPRYGPKIDPTINPDPTSNYLKARSQAIAEADTAVAEARRLGIVAGSTLWYDLEGFDITNTRCRESALRFLSAWTARTRTLGYVSGVYSSAGSGIRMLDDARVNTPTKYKLPDMIWIARWDGRANTSTSYIRSDGWLPGGRMKQYRGGHDERWGGVTINIDTNYLDLGRGAYAGGESHCGGVRVTWTAYPTFRPGATVDASKVRALQCLLKEQGLYTGTINGRYTRATIAAARRWQDARGFAPRDTWGPRDWITLLSWGPQPALKVGSAGPDVRRVQRALHAAHPRETVSPDGVFQGPMRAAVKRYQDRLDLPATGIVDKATWAALRAGRYRLR